MNRIKQQSWRWCWEGEDSWEYIDCQRNGPNIEVSAIEAELNPTQARSLATWLNKQADRIEKGKT